MFPSIDLFLFEHFSDFFDVPCIVATDTLLIATIVKNSFVIKIKVLYNRRLNRLQCEHECLPPPAMTSQAVRHSRRD